eukprot:TRINITY_DN32074_c0_g1_i1.p1 TRINITY_DN32074_c0_g1~~TRINITY_DN32074_c0_g1_i1.p1  ORF type:complete len:197 (-),score=40.04 TRINITY_DN32074_c0_g1_i1:204-794(-)
MHRSNENMNPKVMNLLMRHLSAVQQEKLDGVHYIQNNEDPMDVQAIIEGPTQTPYEGGSYRLKIVIGAEFPAQPPRAVFLTKIFHPNVSPTGDVCVNTLKRDWDPQNWSISHILQVIRCLLIVPFPESALNEEAGKLFMESYNEYFSHAAMINKVHAMATSEAQAADGEANGEEAEQAKQKAQKQAQKSKKTLKRL